MKNNPYLIVGAKYGGMAAGLSIVSFIILVIVFVGNEGTQSIDLFRPILLFELFLIILFCIMGVKEMRNYYKDGVISFVQSMNTCFFIYFTMALTASLVTYLITEFIYPEAFDMFREALMKGVEGETQLGNANAQQFAPVTLAMSEFTRKLFLGVLISLIVSLIYKKTSQTQATSNK